MKKCIIIVCVLSIMDAIGTERIITTQKQFDTEVLNTNQPVIAKFSADYCPACKQAKPIFSKLSNDPDFKGVLFVSIDTEKSPVLSRQYRIGGIPSFLFFNNGSVVERQEGMRGDLKKQLLQGVQKIKRKPVVVKKEVVIKEEVVPARRGRPVRNLVRNTAATTGNLVENVGATVENFIEDL